MSGFGMRRMRGLIDPYTERPSAARTAERAPHLRLIEIIDLDGIVGSSGTFPAALLVVFIGGGAGVHQDPAPTVREFETESVGMRVARLVVGTDGRRIEQTNGISHFEAE